jgi:hypothetical protein
MSVTGLEADARDPESDPPDPEREETTQMRCSTLRCS